VGAPVLLISSFDAHRFPEGRNPVSALIFAYAAIAHPLRSSGNDVNRNDRASDKAYDKEDYLGKNHEKQLRNMSD
jgi:hypothetical protein